MTSRDVIQRLDLAPHPEGGWFRETYRAAETLPAAALPPRYGGPRASGTAIYFLLTAESFSAFHRLQSDEIFHWYAGAPARLVRLAAAGAAETLLGPDLAAGQRPQSVVPRGAWQALCVRPPGPAGEDWTLLGTTVAPGFDFADFEMGRRTDLLAAYPAAAAAIRALTRD
jgi:predicted cupin superfamily sugar epimerase